MKKSFILGLIVLILSMGLVFVGCSTDSDDDGGSSPEIPAVLKGKIWINSITNEKIEFGNKNVTVTLSGGSPKKYNLEKVSDLGIEYFLYFKGLPDSSNLIVVHTDASGFPSGIPGFAGITGNNSDFVKQ